VGKQADILELVPREGLSTNELSGIVDLLGPMSATYSSAVILQYPHEALARA
jgi:hypothetical protein